jgi:hypothetical protein
LSSPPPPAAVAAASPGVRDDSPEFASACLRSALAALCCAPF